MSESSNIQDGELKEFKSQVKQWLTIDEEISKYENKIKELKNIKKKILEPQITTFMITYNVKDLNTENGKIRCNQRVQKKPLNKINIRSNLSQVISDDSQIEQAMQLIMNNREKTTVHVLTKPKNSKPSNSIDTTI